MSKIMVEAMTATIDEWRDMAKVDTQTYKEYGWAKEDLHAEVMAKVGQYRKLIENLKECGCIYEDQEDELNRILIQDLNEIEDYMDYILG